jgi:hypothetical protein
MGNTDHEPPAGGKAQMVKIDKDELEGVKDGLSELNRSMVQLGREITANQQSTTSLWHEVRKIDRKVEKLPGQMRMMLGDHEDDCLALQRIRKKALESSPPSNQPESPIVYAVQQPAVQAVSAPSFSVPKWAVYMAILLGAALIGAGWFIGSVVYGGQSPSGVLKDLGQEAAKNTK